ncbi:MAG TPA: hypothetical protein VJ850_05530 [Candidatus Limnocylindrales bacterium]|nr:hypothetical protein [Candidatus Limnocylindrales bacterium]
MRPPSGSGAAATLIAVVIAACGTSSSPSSGGGSPRTTIAGPPTPAPAFGLTWAQIEDVERPTDAFASAIPTAPSGPGTAGHPGHFPGQSILADVAVAGDRLVAVGYTFIAGAWTADSWTSTNGNHWSLAPVDTRPGSFATSVTARRGGGFVAVGRVGSEPAAWRSDDGRSWAAAAVDGLDRDPGRLPERIETVLATADGLIAGGSQGPELGDRRARFWRSIDGATWTPLPDDAAFAGAEVISIASATDRGYVALGRVGTGQRATSSIAWTSADGMAWTRREDPALAGGLVAAIVAKEAGGWLAVGSDGDEREAVAWSSTDGVAWTRAPREDSRLHSGEKIRMTDVVATSEGYVGIGNFVGLQFGEGTSWVSLDGVTWRRAPAQASLGQGEPEAITAWRDRLVIVGSRGAPDNYIPSAWVGPTAP